MTDNYGKFNTERWVQPDVSWVRNVLLVAQKKFGKMVRRQNKKQHLSITKTVHFGYTEPSLVPYG